MRRPVYSVRDKVPIFIFSPSIPGSLVAESQAGRSVREVFRLLQRPAHYQFDFPLSRKTLNLLAFIYLLTLLQFCHSRVLLDLTRDTLNRKISQVASMRMCCRSEELN